MIIVLFFFFPLSFLNECLLIFHSVALSAFDREVEFRETSDREMQESCKTREYIVRLASSLFPEAWPGSTELDSPHSDPHLLYLHPSLSLSLSLSPLSISLAPLLDALRDESAERRGRRAEDDPSPGHSKRASIQHEG